MSSLSRLLTWTKINSDEESKKWLVSVQRVGLGSEVNVLGTGYKH